MGVTVGLPIKARQTTLLSTFGQCRDGGPLTEYEMAGGFAVNVRSNERQRSSPAPGLSNWAGRAARGPRIRNAATAFRRQSS